MALLKIKPYDNTFFRDGNKFDKDFSTVVSGKNTPYPSVFWGAIFTTLLSENDEFRENYMSPTSKCNIDEILQIKQVYIHNEKEDKTYIKAPLDLFINEKGEVKKGKFVKIENSSLTMGYMLEIPEGDFERVDKKYIRLNNIFDAYKKNQSIRIGLLDESEIFKKNHKIGLGINVNSKIAEESMLYKIEQTEFTNNDWSYIIEYELKDNKILQNGNLRLGGEGKIAKYEEVKNIRDINDYINLRDTFTIPNTAKIVITSEAYFEINDDKSINEKKKEETKSINSIFEKEGLKLIGIANEKPISIGGYDMKDKKYKTMYKGYSAGTIFLIKAQELNIETVQKILGVNSKGFNKFVIIEEKIDGIQM